MPLENKHHYYYLEGRKEFLDQEGEWWWIHIIMDSFTILQQVNLNKLILEGKFNYKPLLQGLNCY